MEPAGALALQELAGLTLQAVDAPHQDVAIDGAEAVERLHEVLDPRRVLVSVIATFPDRESAI